MNSAGLPVLEARNLVKHFHTGGIFSRQVVHAVQDVSLSLYPGHVTALVGESGSGKSTIARMLVRLYQPTGGEILYRGENVLDSTGRQAMLSYRSRVQMIFQDPFGSLNPVHTIEYQLKRPLLIHRRARTKTEMDIRLQELLFRVACTPQLDFLGKYPHQLSGGQRQRVAIARALAVEPEVILADEPISMLDVSIRMGILNLMESLRDEQGISFLYVTHDLASARYFADRILVMYAGHMVEAAPSEELTQDPQHPYTRLLLSSVPDPARGLRTRSQIQLKGEVPNLTAVSVGCPFAPRCPHTMPKCEETMPPAFQLSKDRWVRCFLHEEAAGKTI
jgi:peptide/nickel transport system ATP-binding protein